jgi:ribokinase
MATRRAWTHIDDKGERTITVLGEKLLTRGPLPLEGYDLAYFVSGDVEALRSARGAKFLAATLREQATLREAGVPLDLVVGSMNDPGERYDGSLEAKLVVLTDGANGGTANGERFEATEPAGPVVDTYGAGDSFGGALAFSLAKGNALVDALALAARAGAAVVTGRGPYTSQL